MSEVPRKRTRSAPLRKRSSDRTAPGDISFHLVPLVDERCSPSRATAYRCASPEYSDHAPGTPSPPRRYSFPCDWGTRAGPGESYAKVSKNEGKAER